MPALPADAAVYKTVGPWDQDSLPAAIRGDHRTKADVWGRAVVDQGAVDYVLDGVGRFRLAPGVPGIIPPQATHHLEGDGPFVVRVEFLRVRPATAG